jgi:MoaA/NifB/PqqE/SkfB family radical SAM enzyme
MFTRARRYIFHIELTDKCNAGCPMCPRTDAMNFCRQDREKVFNVELSLDDFQQHFTDEFCARTKEIVFGGAYGDPLAASQLPEIADHLTARGVRIAVSTNGSLRKPEWWRRLGVMMKRTGSRLELHIDGLADTNPLYRVKTNFAKIIENAAAYIKTGARAEWHFIIFRHNQHQIDEAFQLSREMGFAEFTLIDTIRFSGGPRYEYRMPGGETRHLELPTVKAADFRASDGGVAVIERPEQAAQSSALNGTAPGVNGIDCKSAAFNRPYISAHGQVSACCWVTGSNEEAAFFAGHGLRPGRYNIRNRPLKEILLDEPFATLYAKAWAVDSLNNCRHKCGKMLRNKRNRL